ncbi:MAG: type II toxin-antitoxin system HicA family toxin [Chloroflexi bacterium]|nr:type II toxin-antitoxin system HicA family toxin [Chloroflexota bacterium]
MSTGPRRLTQVRYTIVVRIFEREGFVLSRQKGDHLITTKPGVKRPIVIKRSPGQVPVTHTVTNMRTAGMTRERFFALLDEVS